MSDVLPEKRGFVEITSRPERCGYHYMQFHPALSHIAPPFVMEIPTLTGHDLLARSRNK